MTAPHTFDPDAAVAAHGEHLLALGRTPGWADYAIDRAERMAGEEHGMWQPLLEVADQIRQETGRPRRRRSN